VVVNYTCFVLAVSYYQRFDVHDVSGLVPVISYYTDFFIFRLETMVGIEPSTFWKICYDAKYTYNYN